MAGGINFSLDQTIYTSSFKDLRVASQESDKLESNEDQKEKFKNPLEGKDQRSIYKAGSLGSRIKIFLEARQQAGVDPTKPTERENEVTQDDIAAAERRELQFNRQEVSKDARAASRNPRSQGPAGANELDRNTVTRYKASQQVTVEDSSAGSDLGSLVMLLATINRIEALQSDVQGDSLKKVRGLVRNDAIEVEQELIASQIEIKPVNRDVVQGSEVKNRENLEILVLPDERVIVSIRDKKDVEKKTDSIRNESDFANNSQEVIELSEEKLKPIMGSLDTKNRLLGPQPFELRDTHDSSIETERGQNVSKLI
jgi:hypothetical protein